MVFAMRGESPGAPLGDESQINIWEPSKVL